MEMNAAGHLENKRSSSSSTATSLRSSFQILWPETCTSGLLQGVCRALARLLLLLLDLLPGWCVLLALSGSPPVMASLRVNTASSHLLFYLELTNESTIQNKSYFANKLTYSTSTFLLNKYFVKKRERNRPSIHLLWNVVISLLLNPLKDRRECISISGLNINWRRG